MGGLRNWFNQVKAGVSGGPTPPGSWGDLEKFGRFEGTGEVTAELTLPAGPVAVSIEDYLTVQDLDAELTGSSGEALEVKHYSEAPDDDEQKALKNVRRVASARIDSPGLYHLTVRSPNSAAALLILVGEA
jgi:hypothetical protein